MSGLNVGIDLGTTYSLVSVMENGRPRVIKNGLGEQLTPSVVHVAADGTILVGSAARAKATTLPGRTARSFKRDMGTGRRYQLGNQSFNAEELSALVLRELKHDVEAEFGVPITEAVVTVPAYFGELQRRATRAACILAGLRVERIINEPTAAALAYGLHRRDRELRAVVLDLGGGTFDVTVLEIIEGVVEIQATAGDLRLGGDDFVTCLLDHLKARAAQEISLGQLSEEGEARMREACESAKLLLSTEARTRLALTGLPTSDGSIDIELAVTRAEFEDASQPLLARMRHAVQRALRDASCTLMQIDEVLLVGGSTRMPCVAALASQMFGRLPLRNLPPDEAVAMGAAIQVALKTGDVAVADMIVTDIAPFTLGIASVHQSDGASVSGLFAPIIERGAVLPASRVERFQTTSNRQTRLTIEVYQGEHSLCSQNQKLAEYTLTGIPSASAGRESIDVRFSYDMNGILDVDAVIVSTGVSATFTVESTPGRLTAKEIEAARARLQTLKFHPREALPNVTALARADAAFVELTGSRRAALGAVTAAFRLALEGQNRAQVDGAREDLLRVLASFSVND